MQIMPYVAIQFFGGKFYNGGTVQEVMGVGLWCGCTGEGRERNHGLWEKNEGKD